MSDTDVIYGGLGGSKPAVLMWDDPASGGGSVVVSEFDAGYSVYALVISPSGNRLAVGTRAGLLRVCALARHRARTGAAPVFEVFHGSDLHNGVCGLAFLTDELLASGGRDGCIRLWDVGRQRQMAEINAHPGGMAALCSLGSLVLASIGMDGIMRVWDLDTLQPKYESEPFALPQRAALTGLGFDPQTGLLMHASQSGDLHVYDTRQSFVRQLVHAHDGDFCALACGVDRIATAGGSPPKLKLWPQKLDQPVAECSLLGPVLAVGWIGTGHLMTVGLDGSSSFWEAAGAIKPILSTAENELRTCVGLPSKLVAQLRVQADRTWRDQKVTEANALMQQADPQSRQGVLSIVEDLHTRGFSAEASLLLADLAKMDDRILWELESRIGLANRLGDDEAAIPTLYAIGELLERVREPALAMEYFEKIVRRREDYQNARERLRRLSSHPLVAASPESCVRGDFGQGERLLQELEKYRILEKKFRWRFVFDIRQTWAEPSIVKLKELVESVRADLAESAAAAISADIERATLYQGREQKEIEWLYISCGEPYLGLAYGLEIHVQDTSSVITPYAVFDAGVLSVLESFSVTEHNEKVREAWMRIEQSSSVRQWLAAIHDCASKSIRRVVAAMEDVW